MFSGNAEKGLPSVQGAVLLYDPHCGSIRAVIESRLVTQYKTAADSVLGAQYLARPNSRHLVIVGAGMVASMLARAYDVAFPGVERISIWSRRPEQAQALAATLNGIRSEVVAITDLPKAIGQADIVAAATMSQQPVILGQWVRPGTHVDLIGAFTPEMREADDNLIASSSVYVDFVDTVVDRIGELMQPIESGVITRDHVRGDLYDLVAADSSGRQSDNEITLFKNGGGAHLDLMIADYIVNAVKAQTSPKKRRSCAMRVSPEPAMNADLILRSVAQRRVSKDGRKRGLAAILRDARCALLRMRPKTACALKIARKRQRLDLLFAEGKTRRSPSPPCRRRIVRRICSRAAPSPDSPRAGRRRGELLCRRHNCRCGTRRSADPRRPARPWLIDPVSRRACGLGRRQPSAK